ncbi:condensation domain-containing protein [Bacillus licheniformis]|nr:condensation domain-containing protein [Bacillus licheniformis]
MPECQHNRKPLSGAQAGIWFAQQLDPEIRSTIQLNTLKLKARLIRSFRKALRHVIKEAESFHARFGEDQDGPWQEIVPSTDFRYITLMSDQKPIRNRRLKLDDG